jgi:predicted nucleic acid-binding protein
MRVVLDTNILARAARGGSSPAAAVLQLILPPHLLIVSPFLLSELARLPRYPRVQWLHGLAEPGADAYMQRLQSGALLVNPQVASPSIVPHDPKADPVIATAVAGQAEVLCTLDRHFRHPDVQAYCTAKGIRTLSDVQLLPLLRGP